MGGGGTQQERFENVGDGCTPECLFAIELVGKDF